MVEIRPATEADKPAVWQIIKAVIAGGDTYTFAPDTPEEVMIGFWFSPEKHVYVAEEEGGVLGTYWLKANQPGLGDHVGNGEPEQQADGGARGGPEQGAPDNPQIQRVIANAVRWAAPIDGPVPTFGNAKPIEAIPGPASS